MPGDQRLHSIPREIQVRSTLGNEAVGLGQIGQLTEPGGEQGRIVGSGSAHTNLYLVESRRVSEQVAEGGRCFREHIGSRLTLKLELGLGGVLYHRYKALTLTRWPHPS